ncbi:MAG TPA: hypothetical protein VMI73_11085 [Trebonia sp.]|nr:hypothetical protein [Trebonia sp.]
MRHANSPGRPSPASRPDAAAVPRVNEALHAEALRHTPDSAAMLARVGDAAKAGTSRTVRPIGPRQKRPGQWLTPLRVVAAACAALVVTGGGWLIASHLWQHPTHMPPSAESTSKHIRHSTTASAGGGGVAADGSSAVPTSPPASPTTTPSASVATTPGASPATTPSASATATAALGSPGHTRVQQGFLWSDGSIDPSSTTSWSQSDITLKNGEAVTALNVVLRLPDTPGLTNTGAWSTVPTADIAISVVHRSGVLVYTFTLHAGVTLAPGTYEFAGQYSHASGGRNADYDTYLATASAGQTSAEVYGNFFAAN